MKKKSETFTDVFGEFSADGADSTYRPVILTKIDDGRAHPCNDCGEYPTLHDVYFLDKEKHNKQFYIACGVCLDCDGEWYETVDEAIEAWNKRNPLEKVEVEKTIHERRKFIDDILEYSRIRD